MAGRPKLKDGEKGKYTTSHAVMNRRTRAFSFEQVAKRKIIMSYKKSAIVRQISIKD